MPRKKKQGMIRKKQPQVPWHSKAGMGVYHPLGTKVGFPSQKEVQLVFAEKYSLVTSSGVTAQHTFRLNSLYDPDLTGVGHQPLGFDEWTAFYNHYCVTKVEWEIQAVPAAASASTYILAYVSDDTVVPSSVATLVENGADLRIGSDDTGAIIFNGELSVSEFFRRPSAGLVLDSQLRALTGANPAEQVLLTVSSVPTTTPSTTTFFAIRLVYTAMFMEPKDLGPS